MMVHEGRLDYVVNHTAAHVIDEYLVDMAQPCTVLSWNFRALNIQRHIYSTRKFSLGSLQIRTCGGTKRSSSTARSIRRFVSIPET